MSVMSNFFIHVPEYPVFLSFIIFVSVHSTSDCVKAHVWMKNKPHMPSKSRNKVGDSQNL